MATTKLQQTRKIGTAGSLQNQLMGNNSTVPVVGEYAIHLMYSDRYPYKVVEVSECGTQAVLMHLDVEHTPAGYVYHETEGTMTVQYRKSGWHTVSSKIGIDPKFVKAKEAEHGKMYGSFLLTEEERKAIYFNESTQRMEMWPQNIIAGVTKAKKEYCKISLLFRSTPDYYYDPSF